MARYGCEISLDSSPAALERIAASRKVVDDKLAENVSIYGVSTGFGGSGKFQSFSILSLFLLHPSCPVVYTLILSPSNAHEPYLGKIRFDDIIFSTCHFRKFEFRLTFCFTQRTRERTISPLWVSHSCSTNIRVYSPFQRTIRFRSSMVLRPLAKSQKPAEFLFLSPLPCRP